MTDLTVYQGAEVQQAQTISYSLIEDFIKFIDGSPKTTQTYITNLRQFAAWIDYTGINRPQYEDIISYRDWLLSEHEAIQLDKNTNHWTYQTDKNGCRIVTKCKANTVIAYLRSVKQFFAWTGVRGLYDNVAAGVHTPKADNMTHKKDALTPAEVISIEQSIDAQAAAKKETAAAAGKDTAGRVERATEQGLRIRAIYALAVNAGLRTVEISRANVKDLETKGKQTYLYIWGKGHAEADQKKALAPEVAAAILDYLNSRTDHYTGSSPLFVSTGNRKRTTDKNGKPIPATEQRRIAPTTISTMLKRAMQAAGYNSERLTAHSLRHTAGTAVQEMNGDLHDTQIYMRHASPVTTEIYLHNETEKKDADIANRLYTYYHSFTPEEQQAAAAV